MKLRRLGIQLGLLCFTHPTMSAEYCIQPGDTPALLSALQDAASNGDDNSIFLAAGSYALDSDTPQLAYFSATSQRLTIEGGYTAFFEGGCGKLVQYRAADTVIDGAGGDHSASAITLFGSSGGRIELKFLKIQNAINTDPQGSSAVVLGQAIGSEDVSVDLENTIFEGNIALNYFPIRIGAAQTVIRNSVFAKTQVFGGFPQILANIDGMGTCAAILNSTFVGNTGGSRALELRAGMGCTPLIANSLFWGNSSGDLYLSMMSQSSVFLLNDDIHEFGSSTDVTVNGQETLMSVNPLFVDASAGNYALSDFSLLHDKGSSLELIGGPGSFDVVGFKRTDGASPDIGAFEIQDVIFANGSDQ